MHLFGFNQPMLNGHNIIIFYLYIFYVLVFGVMCNMNHKREYRESFLIIFVAVVTH